MTNRYAFLIIAHKNPDHLKRLISRLQSQHTVFYVHIDKKISIDPFKKALEEFEISWVRRERAQWGSIGMVKAILNGLQMSAADSSIKRLTMISGADYPIKPVDYIVDFFENSSEDFIDIVSFEQSGWSVAKKNRIKKHYFFIKDRLFEYPQNTEQTSLARNALNLLLSLVLKKERAFPKGLEPFGGWTWFSLTNQTVQKMLSFHQQNPSLFKFMKRTLSSDEVFMHTILGNSYEDISTFKPSVTFTHWMGDDTPHPQILDETYFKELQSSSLLFARKFEYPHSQQLLDNIDSQLLDKKQPEKKESES